MIEGGDVLESRVIREVAAVFRGQEILENAIQALLQSGFDRSDIDIMSDAETIRRRLGVLYVAPEEIADIPIAPRRAYIARMLFYLGAATAAMAVVASGGSLALVAAAAAAAGTAGAGVGAAAIHHLGKKQAEDLELQLMAGGIVVWVRVHNRKMEERAQEVLAKSGGEAIRVHEIEIEKRLDDLPLSKFNPDPWLGHEPPARH